MPTNLQHSCFSPGPESKVLVRKHIHGSARGDTLLVFALLTLPRGLEFIRIAYLESLLVLFSAVLSIILPLFAGDALKRRTLWRLPLGH